MVHLRDLINPIPKTMVFKYQPGDNVCYQDKCYTVHRHRVCDGAPAYLLKACKGDACHDKVLESACSDCCSTHIINEAWPDFVYTGDNLAASKFVLDMVAQTTCCKQVSYGPNEDNTAYVVTYFCEGDNVMKTLTKNKTN